MEYYESTEPIDPAVKALGTIIIGMGLAALILWLNPYTLTELIMVFGVPFLIILSLLFATGLIGKGTIQALNSKELGARIQAYVRQETQQ